MNDPDFYSAIRNNELQRVEHFYINVKKANLNEKNKHGNPPLLIAVMSKHLEMVNLLVKHGAKLDDFDRKKNTNPLQTAVKSNLIKMVELLINLGASLNLTNIRGETALMIATQNGFWEITSLLLCRDIDLDIKLEGDTAHTMALKTENFFCAELIDSYINPPRALQAVRTGNYDEFFTLQSLFSNRQYTDTERDMLLYEAIQRGNLQLITQMIALIKANTIETIINYQAILYTVSNYQLDVLRLLLLHLHINTQSPEYNLIISTSLHIFNAQAFLLLLTKIGDNHLANRYRFIALCDSLKNNKADFCKAIFNPVSNAELGDYTDSDGNNLLLWATYFNNIEMVRCFSQICNVNSANMHNETPIEIAIAKEHWQLVPILKERGASFKTQKPLFFSSLNKGQINTSLLLAQDNPNEQGHKDDQNNSALHIMANQLNNNTEDKISLLTLLLRTGLPIDEQNNEGDTPLMVAIHHNNSIMVCALVLAGGRMDIQNRNNETGSSIAISNGMNKDITSWSNYKLSQHRSLLFLENNDNVELEKLPELFTY